MKQQPPFFLILVICHIVGQPGRMSANRKPWSSNCSVFWEYQICLVKWNIKIWKTIESCCLISIYLLAYWLRSKRITCERGDGCRKMMERRWGRRYGLELNKLLINTELQGCVSWASHACRFNILRLTPDSSQSRTCSLAASVLLCNKRNSICQPCYCISENPQRGLEKSGRVGGATAAFQHQFSASLNVQYFWN